MKWIPTAHAARWKKTLQFGEVFPVEVELQAAMERRGLTQGQAASELGVSQKTVSVWLRGDKPPSRERAEKIREWIAKG
jgi:predicted transcriptional regulator